MSRKHLGEVGANKMRLQGLKGIDRYQVRDIGFCHFNSQENLRVNGPEEELIKRKD